jgi:hypothetical protein
LTQDTSDISVSSATIEQRGSTPILRHRVNRPPSGFGSLRGSLSSPQDWLGGQKSLDHLVQALDHDGWWSAFESLRATPPGAPRSKFERDQVVWGSGERGSRFMLPSAFGTLRIRGRSPLASRPSPRIWPEPFHAQAHRPLAWSMRNLAAHYGLPCLEEGRLPPRWATVVPPLFHSD